MCGAEWNRLEECGLVLLKLKGSGGGITVEDDRKDGVGCVRLGCDCEIDLGVLLHS